MKQILASVVLDKRRPLKDGITYPVRLRITHGERRYYPITINNKLVHTTEADWNRIQSKRVKGDDKKLKIKLNEVEARAEKIIEEMPVFTFSKFKKIYLGKHNGKVTLKGMFEEYVQKLRQQKRVSTASSYECTLNSLTSYKVNFDFKDITPEFLESYERWMTDNGNTKTTTGIYLRNLRAILNNAIRIGYFKKELYPFGRGLYVIPAGQNIKKALTIEEIRKLVEYNTAPGWESMAKDLWLFSYFTSGANLKDIARLRYRDIVGDELVFVRAKTENARKQQQKPVVVHLLPQAKEIIQRWGNKPADPDRLVFSILEEGCSAERERQLVQQFNKQVNKYMRRVATDIGIKMNITYYGARHSYATILRNSGASTEFISEALGHSDVRTTRAYLDSFENDTRKQYTQALVDFY